MIIIILADKITYRGRLGSLFYNKSDDGGMIALMEFSYTLYCVNIF